MFQGVISQIRIRNPPPILEIRLISRICESKDKNLACTFKSSKLSLSLSEQDYNGQSAIMSFTENTFPKMCFIRGGKKGGGGGWVGGIDIFTMQIEREIMVECNRV